MFSQMSLFWTIPNSLQEKSNVFLVGGKPVPRFFSPLSHAWIILQSPRNYKLEQRCLVHPEVSLQGSERPKVPVYGGVVADNAVSRAGSSKTRYS
jgi:hypothetical protein